MILYLCINLKQEICNLEQWVHTYTRSAKPVLHVCVGGNCTVHFSHVLLSHVAWCVIVLLASKYKLQSHNGLQQRHCENKLVVVTQFSMEVGREQRPINTHPVKSRWWVGISSCHMIRTFLLYCIKSMLILCERLSATVTAKKVTLILSTIVLLQGLPAGNIEQAQGTMVGGKEGGVYSTFQPLSRLSAGRLPHPPFVSHMKAAAGGWGLQLVHAKLSSTSSYISIPWCKNSQWLAAQWASLCFSYRYQKCCFRNRTPLTSYLNYKLSGLLNTADIIVMLSILSMKCPF